MHNREIKPFTYRRVKIGCTDSIGEKYKTFTVDENEKQNSPSFNCYFDFCQYKNEARLYQFRYDLKKTEELLNT